MKEAGRVPAKAAAMPACCSPTLHRRRCRPADPKENIMFTCAASRIVTAVLAGLISPVILSAAEPADKPLPRQGPPSASLRALTIFPQHVTLDGPRDSQQLIVLGEYADGRQWDLTREAVFAPDSADVARA